MCLSCTLLSAQSKKLPEYMAAAGFTQVNDSTWVKGTDATVTMNGSRVKAFEAKQTHSWAMTFGNGAQQGAVINVKTGDKIKFADGCLTFADGSVFRPTSTDGIAQLKRSILRTAIFNPAFKQLYATDIKTSAPSAESLGVLVKAGSASSLILDEYGNIRDKVEKDRAQLQAKRAATYQNMQKNVEKNAEAEYERLCKKYGRNVIDGLNSGKIMVGAPIDMVKSMMKENVISDYEGMYTWKTVSEGATEVSLEFSPQIYPTNEWHDHFIVKYSKKTGLVTYYYTMRRYY